MNVLNGVREAGAEAAQFFAGRYPDFVTAARPESLEGEIPVFVFHSIEPVEFEAQLRHLKENGYRTLDCATLLRCMTGEERIGSRSVMLTIDDGRASVWTHGFPLLKKYGMTAVVFLIPGLMREGGAPRPTLEDVWEKRLAPGSLKDPDPDLMTWAEVAAMAKSGAADFQSHTLHHHKTPVGPEILGAVPPPPSPAIYDIPVAPREEDIVGPDARDALTGSPIFAANSPMAGGPIFRPDPDFLDECRAEPGPLAEIRRRARDYEARHGALGGFLSKDAALAEIARSLRTSREIIRERLDGAPVEHLCYPYTIGSTASARLSREAGYKSNFWGLLPENPINRRGDDPFRITRLKGDFVQRLPGRGRKGLGGIFFDKINRRLSGRPVY